MDTYAQALINFHKGKKPDTYEIIRDDGYSSVISISQFFDDSNFSDIESLALSNCNEKVLDIGAGVGRHSSELQRRGFDVTGGFQESCRLKLKIMLPCPSLFQCFVSPD